MSTLYATICYLPVTNITRIFAKIPPNITSLDLGSNYLCDRTGAELAQVFAAIPPNITSINLRDNDLGCLAGIELAQAFAAIPANINSIDLSGNGLGDFYGGAKLAQVFAALPTHVKSINLNHNNILKSCITLVFETLRLKNISDVGSDLQDQYDSYCARKDIIQAKSIFSIFYHKENHILKGKFLNYNNGNSSGALSVINEFLAKEQANKEITKELFGSAHQKLL